GQTGLLRKDRAAAPKLPAEPQNPQEILEQSGGRGVNPARLTGGPADCSAVAPAASRAAAVCRGPPFCRGPGPHPYHASRFSNASCRTNGRSPPSSDCCAPASSSPPL